MPEHVVRLYVLGCKADEKTTEAETAHCLASASKWPGWTAERVAAAVAQARADAHQLGYDAALSDSLFILTQLNAKDRLALYNNIFALMQADNVVLGSECQFLKRLREAWPDIAFR